jgi:hypothetical protein
MLMILPVTAIYIQVYLINPAMMEILFNVIMALALAIPILVTSFYLVYHPTKAR